MSSCSVRNIRTSAPFSLCISALFREFGGARCVHNIVKYRQCREHALLIIQQLVLSPSGDDDMGTLLGLMHSAPSSELQLKTDILRVKARTQTVPVVHAHLLTVTVRWHHLFTEYLILCVSHRMIFIFYILSGNIQYHAFDIREFVASNMISVLKNNYLD